MLQLITAYFISVYSTASGDPNKPRPTEEQLQELICLTPDMCLCLFYFYFLCLMMLTCDMDGVASPQGRYLLSIRLSKISAVVLEILPAAIISFMPIYWWSRKPRQLTTKCSEQFSQTAGLTLFKCPTCWTAFTGSLDDQGEQYRLTTVTPEMKENISSLMETCWKEDETVVGRDGRGLYQKKFRILEIQQVENPIMFFLYQAKRRTIQTASSSDIPDVRVKTKGKYPRLDQRLVSDVNECYLWHGTKEDIFENICREGFDVRLARNGMFGRGIYFAEKSSKANQYAGLSIIHSNYNFHNFSNNVCLRI